VNKNKNEDKNNDVSWVGKLLQSSFKMIGNHYFGTRAKLNKEKVLVLSRNNDFISDIDKVREFLKIPKLDPSNDFRVFEYQGEMMEDSGFLYEKNNNYIVKFEREIRKILKKYELPINFTDWIEHAVLYNKFLKTGPKYNPEIVSQISHDTKEAKRIGLTTREKQFVKDYIRLKIKTEGKNQKDFDNFYKTICKALVKSKNTRRQSKNISIAIKTLNKPNEVKEYDWTEEKEITHKFSFNDLAQKLVDKDLNELEIKKIANKLRQQKHRINRKILPKNK
jgi:hypothetical protein